jgi:hypothetical protein
LAQVASGVNADSGEIIAHMMTDHDTGDASQAGPLLDQIDGPIARFTADGAYDGKPVYDAIIRDGRMKWQASTGYGRRALVETAIGRYKSIIGRRLRARSFHAQQTEVAIGCAILNRMLDSARPKSVRRKATTV